MQGAKVKSIIYIQKEKLIIHLTRMYASETYF